MAVEARKSAWGRSWSQNWPIVPMPGEQNRPNPRKCVMIEGSDGASISVSPSHPVALRSATRYVLTGQFMADGPSGLKLQLSHAPASPQFESGPKDNWKQFSHEFVTGENSLWLGRLTLSLAGSGTIWLDGISLKPAAAGPELLAEADVNRPLRGAYNQLDCFMLDKIVESAEQNGIYLMLCLITRDLYMNSLSKTQSPDYHQAVADAKKFMRYAVARWSYSTNVAAWEYFNEIDPGKPTDKFYDEVGAYLEKIDIYPHLRTTSTWGPSPKDCRHERLDIAQVHHYMRPDKEQNFKDEVTVIIERTSFLREHAPNKPVLIGEFGLATPKWGLSEHMKQDNEAVHFHNSLWASAFAGGSGTAMFWWWDQLDRQDAYGHYRPLARFLADVSFAGMHKLNAVPSTEKLRPLGYQTSDLAYLWLFDSRAAWSSLVIEKKQPPQIEAAAVEINGLSPGSYSIEWWHTYQGNPIRTDRISFTKPPLRITAPPFTRDIACKIKQTPASQEPVFRKQ